MLASALVLDLLLTANGGCYLVTNTRIARLPTCDFGPATIELLAHDPAPDGPGRPAENGGYAPRSASPGWGGGPTTVRGKDELERRLALSEQQRLAAISARVAAEQERDAALRQRDRAMRDLVRVRRRVAAGASRRGHRPREGPAKGNASPATSGRRHTARASSPSEDRRTPATDG